MSAKCTSPRRALHQVIILLQSSTRGSKAPTEATTTTPRMAMAAKTKPESVGSIPTVPRESCHTYDSVVIFEDRRGVSFFFAGLKGLAVFGKPSVISASPLIHDLSRDGRDCERPNDKHAACVCIQATCDWLPTESSPVHRTKWNKEVWLFALCWHSDAGRKAHTQGPITHEGIARLTPLLLSAIWP